MKNKIILRPQLQNGLYGFADLKGDMNIKPQYEDVDVFREGVCWVKLNDKWGLINQKGEFIISPQFDGAREFNEGLANVKIDGKWGVIDKDGKILVPPEFDYIDSFKDSCAYIRDNNKYGFVFLEPTKIIPPAYEDVRGFSEGLAAVLKDGKWGYIDLNGKMVINPEYNSAGKFINGKAYVVKEGKGCFINKNGAPQGEFEEIEFDDKWSYEDEPWYDRGERTLHGFIDKKGKFIIRPKFRAASSLNLQGIATVKIDRKWGIIDTTGTYIIEPEYDDLRQRSKDTYIGSLKGKEHFIEIDRNYTNLIPLADIQSDESDKAHFGAISDDDLTPVEINGKWGYKNDKGEIVIPPKFNRVGEFENGVSLVWLNRKCGFIDKEGLYVIKPLFDNIGRRIENGYIRVAVAVDGGYVERWGVMDVKGKYVVAPEYEYILPAVNEDMARIMQVESFGFVECRTGNTLAPVFDYVWDFSNGLAHVRLTEKQIEQGVCKQPVFIENRNNRLSLWQKKYDAWEEKIKKEPVEQLSIPTIPGMFDEENQREEDPEEELPF